MNSNFFEKLLEFIDSFNERSQIASHNYLLEIMKRIKTLMSDDKKNSLLEINVLLDLGDNIVSNDYILRATWKRYSEEIKMVLRSNI